MRRPVAALALAALLVLAGCTGVNPLGESGNDTDDGNVSLIDEDEVPENVTTTAGAASTDESGTETTSEPGAGPSEAASAATPPGIAANGSVTNVSALRAAHIRELRSLASYRLVVDREQRNRRVSANISIDNRAGEYAGEEARGRVYYTDGTAYVKRDDGSVSSSEFAFDRIHRGGTELVGIIGGLNLTVANRTTAAGTPVVRYRVTGFDPTVITEIQNLTGFVRITPDGLIREVSLDATVPSGETLKQRYAVEAINDTTVETPEWFEQYRQGGGESDGSDGDAGDGETTDREREGFPEIQWQFSLRDDGRVRIAHQGGERAESLTVRYTAGGETVTETWDPEGNITAGDTYVTETAPDDGTVVRLVWTGDDRTVTIAQREVRQE